MKPFLRRSQKSQWKETIQSQHCESQFVPGWTDFFLVPFKQSRFPLFGIIGIQAGKRSSSSITKRSCATGIDFLHKQFKKHKRPISREDLEVLYAANQLGLNAPESFANSAWFNTILHFGKRGHKNQLEMKPGFPASRGSFPGVR